MNDTTGASPSTVRVTGEAHRALGERMREWSGWPHAALVLGEPEGSPYASCNHVTKTFTVNVDRLVRNPNRVLRSVNPFRLRQEAILTGAMLHEAAHARFSNWAPRTEEQAEAVRHSDGSRVTRQTGALATLMEEPRIEGLMTAEAVQHGATGLAWTMRASAAHLLPMTEVSTEPGQEVMDVITSWALRAGRSLAIGYATNARSLPTWTYNFSILLEATIKAHLDATTEPEPDSLTSNATKAVDVRVLLTDMIRCTDHTGPMMFDIARDVLRILFPETDGDAEDAPMPGAGCQGSGEAGEAGRSDESGEGEEADSEGEGEGSLAEKLAELEDEIEKALGAEAEAEQKAGPPASGSGGINASEAGPGGQRCTWRAPDKDDREYQRRAEKFLRDLIDTSDSSKVLLTDAPSATVDGGAMASWKAGGQANAPHFFRRTHREVSPTPPVKIAVLVDVSGSMDVLQDPSALLSWALSAAGIDLRNFAGRGTQVETCLIHWGDDARVVQRNGKALPGIPQNRCNEGTVALAEALELADRELGNLLDGEPDGSPSNRLVVNFTDWILSGGAVAPTTVAMSRGLASGVNFVSVLPPTGEVRWSSLARVLAGCPVQRGRHTSVVYNDRNPHDVWDQTAAALR